MIRRSVPTIGDAKRTARRTGVPLLGLVALTVVGDCRSILRPKRSPLSQLSDRLASLRDDRDDDGTTSPSAPSNRPTTRAELVASGFTPREYVHDVLHEHEGRLRQCDFVERYGWSPATISRLLSDLETDGDVVRYRLGREKVVCLPSAVPPDDR